MGTSSTSRGNKNAPPQEFAQTPPPTQFDQFAVMQSIMEIQKDVTRLVHETSRVAQELQDLKTETASVKHKVGRAEATVVAGGALVVIFAVFLWWLFSAPITYLRDQMIVQQPQISQPAAVDSQQPQ